MKGYDLEVMHLCIKLRRGCELAMINIVNLTGSKITWDGSRNMGYYLDKTLYFYKGFFRTE